GSENFFLFGKTVQQVEETRAAGYHPREVYESDEDLRGAIDLINAGLFSHGDRDLFRPLTDSLLDSDPFLVCADFRDYVECQGRVALAYRDAEQWSRMSILNVARCGRFSSDRAIREYSEDIWNVVPLKGRNPKADPITLLLKNSVDRSNPDVHRSWRVTVRSSLPCCQAPDERELCSRHQLSARSTLQGFSRLTSPSCRHNSSAD